jgi:PEP-CTERM motif
MGLTKGLFRKTAVCATVLAAIFVLSATAAKADSITYSLSQGNTSLSPYPGPYGQVTVTLTSTTTATITFDSCGPDGDDVCSNSSYLFVMGGANAAGVNVNSTSWTLGPVSGSNSEPGFTPGPWSDGGLWVGGGSFGSFNQTVTSFDGFKHSSTEISFTLTNDSGTWASASDVLTANADGNLAEMHGFVCTDTTQSDCTSVIVTGYASNAGGSPVPEPASIALFGSGLMTLAGMIRRRRQTKS